jgi:hypothetical protein
MSTGHQGEDAASPRRPFLRIVKGDPTEAEIAALVAVLQAAAAAAGTSPPRKPHSAWSAPHRRLRTMPPSGPGAWRASSLPR